MRQWYKINAKAKETDILIYGYIGEDFWGDGVSAKALVDELDGYTSDLNVYINSGGGDIQQGKAIINAFNRYKEKNNATITTVVDGDALSMASGIFMVGDTRKAHENSTFMIHDPWTIAGGNSKDFRAMADILDMESTNLLTAYRTSGLEDSAITKMMNDETWLRGEDIVSQGFATELVEPMKMAASYDKRILNKFHNVPEWAKEPKYVIEMDCGDGVTQYYSAKGGIPMTPPQADNVVIEVVGNVTTPSLKELQAALNEDATILTISELAGPGGNSEAPTPIVARSNKFTKQRELELLKLSL